MDTTVTTLRPGFLVSLQTSVRGNCKYATQELEAEHYTAEGEKKARWETEKTVTDPAEHERALKARSLARSAVQTVCAKSCFGLLCPEAKKDKLDAAIAKGRAIANDFNRTASLTAVEFNVMVGYVSPDDVEAVKSINFEVRKLLATMEAGVRNLDVTAIREAAQKAKSVSQMLEPNAKERVEKALVVARQVARDIKKAGEAAAVEVDQIAVQRLKEARTSFLDIDEVTIDAVEPEGRSIDVIPELTPEEEEEIRQREIDEQAAWSEDEPEDEPAPVTPGRNIEL